MPVICCHVCPVHPSTTSVQRVKDKRRLTKSHRKKKYKSWGQMGVSVRSDTAKSHREQNSALCPVYSHHVNPANDYLFCLGITLTLRHAEGYSQLVSTSTKCNYSRNWSKCSTMPSTTIVMWWVFGSKIDSRRCYPLFIILYIFLRWGHSFLVYIVPILCHTAKKMKTTKLTW